MPRELDLTSFNTTHKPRPYANAFVRPHHTFSAQERYNAAVEAGWNVFNFPSKMLRGGDLLSDSGTTTLTLEQLSALIMGDEAYGSNWGYPQLLEMFERTFGIDTDECGVYLFHQGRAAEHALYSNLKNAHCVPSNSFFDTTRANAENNGITALDLSDVSSFHFKGNIDLAQLERVLAMNVGLIPFVLMTITNNTGGGQPVSMENLRVASDMAHARGVSFFLDACRFAENAWFIKQYEDGYEDETILDIIHEMFSLCDGFTISLKKDGLANMGGALVIKKSAPLLWREKDLLERLYDHQILTEGHPSYGGLSGRDIMTIVEGLKYVVTEEYLDGRIGLVHDFGTYMVKCGIPVLEPFGGHAIYIDVDRFFAGTHMRREDFGGISLTALLLLKGVRLCELGAWAFGTYNEKTGKDKLSERNYVRAAVPRNKYERNDLCYVADCITELHAVRDKLPKAVPTYGREKTLRHFKARFDLRWP